jgi:hypothetical protein
LIDNGSNCIVFHDSTANRDVDAKIVSLKMAHLAIDDLEFFFLIHLKHMLLLSEPLAMNKPTVQGGKAGHMKLYKSLLVSYYREVDS